jgi:uncharacterized protein involved in oxidation of intracellular sulfur
MSSCKPILRQSSTHCVWRSTAWIKATRFIFLSGKGVEIDRIEDPKFNVRAQCQEFLDAGGQFFACGTCLKLRNSEGSEVCPLATLSDHYEIVRDSERLLTV